FVFSDIEITNDDFDTWRNKYIKALTRKIKTYEENTNKPDTDIELKQLENNKKAWLEFVFSDIEITNDDFDTWRNKYIKALT
ncbi:hypothetical protein, partial [Klebsiella pneumoniae]|uniref:hypothetical protein n=1 Tax=Klebsiella pneumoniae TaxID=573 RepID=UPI00159571F5